MDHKGQEQIALHRWAVIAEAAGDKLTAQERGSLSRFDFQRTSPPSDPASLATSLILEFHRREWDRVSPDSAVVVVSLFIRLLFAFRHHLLPVETNRKFLLANLVSRRPSLYALMVEFLDHLL